MSELAAANLGHNIRRLRDARGISQAQLARLGGMPRPTIANLESGAANPTLSVLLKVAEAFRVTVEELIAPPRGEARLYKATELLSRRRGQVTIAELIPEPIPTLQMERLTLPAGSGMTGVPHTPGTREYLACERGQIALMAAGERYVLGAGDVLAFRGDQKHAYRNPGRSLAVGYSVVALKPGG